MEANGYTRTSGRTPYSTVRNASRLVHRLAARHDDVCAILPRRRPVAEHDADAVRQPLSASHPVPDDEPLRRPAR